MADCVYFPTRGRTANVCLAPGLQEYELVLGTTGSANKKKLSLEDIRVGATLDRLYLKSASLGKEIIFTANNMLNFRASPALYRFLREVSLENFRIWQSFDWGTLRRSPFLPRIQYRKIILSPARWNLSTELLGMEEGVEKTNWRRTLSEWRQDWMVPRYVYMGVTDQRILLDLEHNDHCKLLVKELMKKKTVTLLESFYQEGSGWIKGPEDSHFIGEFVFPLKKIDKKPISSPVTPLVKTETDKQRLSLPGSDCLFLKLYTPKARQNELIAGPMFRFAQGMKEKGLADRWFFMRYADSESHIRLRFFGDPSQLNSRVLPAIHDWSRQCVTEGLIKNMVIDTYDPELERYGGPQLIKQAEAIFAADSLLAAKLIELLRFSKISLSEEAVASINMVDFMQQFGLNFEERLRWLDGIVDKSEYRKEFQSLRKPLIDITLYDNVWECFPEKEELLRFAQERQYAILRFLQELEIAEQKGLLWNEKNHIFGSLLHMTCNRLMGDNSKEKKARAFARHALYSQQYLRLNRSTSTGK